jgi:LuxR family maltose regulon positive regulatory protein
LSYLREFEHVTLARLLLVEYQYGGEGAARALQEALGLLERLLNGAEEGGRAGSAIEILLLQALAHQARGDSSAALAPLRHALALAEPEGYARVFVDEGPPMAQLLLEAAARKIMPGYTARLLASFDHPAGTGDRPPASGPEPAPLYVTPSGSSSPSLHGLVEPLSERESEVLRLLRSDLSGPEIANALTVSLNSVYTHTKNIYAKLGVNSRRAAVRRAEELRLL